MMRRLLQGPGRRVSHLRLRPAPHANRLHLRASGSNRADNGEDLAPYPAKTDMVAHMAMIEAYRERKRALKARHGDNEDAIEIEENQDFWLERGHQNWGWSVYRTHYEDDKQWNIFKSKFRSILLSGVHQSFPPDEAEERSKHIHFPFLEDRARFEVASKAQLREHFLEYRNSEANFKERGLPGRTAEERQNHRLGCECREWFFLVADAAAIASVVNAPEHLKRWQTPAVMPWINVVEADWKPDVGDEFETPDNGYELVEGCDLFDVGFHRAALQTLYPRHWEMANLGETDLYYVRPPKIYYQP